MTTPASAPLTPSEKVAMILRNLSENAQAKLLTRFSVKSKLELEQLLAAMKSRDLPPEQARSVLLELEHRLDEALRLAQRATLSSSDPEEEATEETNAAQKKVRDASTTSEEECSELLAQLRTWKPSHVAAVLVGESPSVVAAILRCAEVETAGEIMKRLSPEVSGKALRSLQAPLSTTLLKPILQPLFKKRDALLNDPMTDIEERGEDASVAKMIELLKLQTPSRRPDILAELENSSPQIAAKVKEEVYTINDLLLVEDSSIQVLLREVSTEDLALALNECAEEVKDKILDNMSKRARDSILDEQELNRSAPLSRIKEAQLSVVQEMLRLGAEGAIQWTTTE